MTLHEVWLRLVRRTRCAWASGKGLLIGPRPYQMQRVREEPDRLQPNVLYVIEDTGRDWAACMACPGGCGQILHMNLLPDSRPVWNLRVERGDVPTLTPSVWRREGCGCHFNLRRGRIEWC